MKLKSDFILQSVGSETVLVPIGPAAERFRGVVQLNRTAAVIVRALQQDTDEAGLLAALRREYDGTEEQFRRAMQTTLDTLRKVDALAE